MVAKAEAVIGPGYGAFLASDGETLYFEDSGGAGRPLFFVYGLACSIMHWKYPRAHFAKLGRRQVWMDFRGHGNSPMPALPHRLSIEGMADDLAELCANRGISNAVFLGQSMGGTVALALAARYPELVSGLVLLGSPGRDPSPAFPLQPLSRLSWLGVTTLNRIAPRFLRLAHHFAERSLEHPAALLVLREMIRSGGFNAKLARTEDIDEYVEHVLKVDPQAFYDLMSDMRDFDVAKLSASIRCPSLVVAGAMDKIVPPSESRYLAKHLPGAELVMVPHGSHCPHFDDPTYVNTAIHDFLAARHL